jgi:hypothetical protein
MITENAALPDFVPLSNPMTRTPRPLPPVHDVHMFPTTHNHSSLHLIKFTVHLYNPWCYSHVVG